MTQHSHITAYRVPESRHMMNKTSSFISTVCNVDTVLSPFKITFLKINENKKIDEVCRNGKSVHRPTSSHFVACSFLSVNRLYVTVKIKYCIFDTITINNVNWCKKEAWLLTMLVILTRLTSLRLETLSSSFA